MNHPKVEEWALYVSDDITPEQRDALAAHLRECSPCAQQVAGLQRTVQRLEAWDYSPATRHSWSAPIVKWSIAAAIVLGIGFGLGRFSTPATRDVTAMRAELETSVKSSLQADLRRARAAVLAAMEERLSGQTEEQMNRVVRNIVDAMNAAREDDRNTTRLLFEKILEQHENDIRWLRADLETLALHADDEIRLAHFQLRKLTSRTEPQK